MANDKSRAILDSAELLFATKGFQQTTVSDIAKESGITHEASIYSYFANKRDILFAIYAAYLQKASEALNAHFQGMKEPGPKLRKAIWHYLADLKDHPNYARILMMAQRESPDFYASEYVGHLEQYVNLVLDVVIAAQKDGTFRSDIRPRLIRNMAMGACVHKAFQSVARNEPYDPHEISDQVYELVLNAARVQTSSTTNAKKAARSGGELRRYQILETAINVFASKGFSNATVSEVAKQANLGDATLYEYFRSKEAILLGTSEARLQDLGVDGPNAGTHVSEAEKDLRKLIWRWVWLICSDEDFSRVLFLELFRNINFYSSPGYSYLLEFFAQVQDAVRRGQEEGVFIEAVPFPAYTHMITGTFDQYLLSQFLRNKPPLGIAKLNRAVDALVWAIKARNGL